MISPNISAPALEELLLPLSDRLDSLSWPEAVSHYTNSLPFAAKVAFFHQMTSRHLGNRLLLAAGVRQSALVMDGGLGTAAITLAGEYNVVYALYTSRALLRVAKARVRHLGITNIYFQYAESLQEFRQIPWNLDAVVISPVKGTNVPDSFLQTVFQHLSESGSVMLGAERFKVSESLAMLRLYRKLSRRFPKVDVFGYDRGYADSWEIRPLTHRPRNVHNAMRQIVRAGTSRTAVYVASKQRNAVSHLDRIRTVLERSMDCRILWENIFFANPAGIGAIARRVDGVGRIVVRIPLSEAARSRHQRNFSNLSALASVDRIGFCTPRPLACLQSDGYQFSAESVVPGASVPDGDLRNERTFGELLWAATTALLSLQQVTRLDGPLSGEIFGEMVERPLAAAWRLLTQQDPQDGAEHLPCATRIIREGLRDATLPVVFGHGDFTIDNLRIEGGAVSGVFDWDLGNPAGLPLVDLLYLIVSSYIKRTGAGLNQAYTTKCVLLQFDAVERAQIERYCSVLSINPRFLRPLALLTWLHHLAVRNVDPEPYNYCRTFWTEPLLAMQKVACGSTFGAPSCTESCA